MPIMLTSCATTGADVNDTSRIAAIANISRLRIAVGPGGKQGSGKSTGALGTLASRAFSTGFQAGRSAADMALAVTAAIRARGGVI